MHERLLNLFNHVGSPRVLLLGDFMLDNYLYGDAERISLEAPVMIMNVSEREERPGGAASVAADLAALDAQVACVGVVGDDANGRRLREMLAALLGVNVEGLVAVPHRCTTLKQRIVGLTQHRHQQQLMRIDEEDSSDISSEVQEMLADHVARMICWCDVICLQDYNKGVLCGEFSQRVIALAKKHDRRVVVDAASINDYSRYQGAWLVKPNRPELSRATGVQLAAEESWLKASASLAQQYDIENVVVTLDKQGAYIYQHGMGEQQGKGGFVPTRPRDVADGTGAGDMFLAMLGVLVGSDYSGIEPPNLTEMVALANIAGGLEVEQFGCVGISRDEIIADLTRESRTKSGKLRSLDALVAELQWYRQQEQKIVFTNGCFDLLHPGHISLLSQAKERGDVLVVAINSDRSVRELKGPSRPILKEHDRAALLGALEAVDYVIIFDAPDPLALIARISPDVLVKGADWTGQVVGQEWVEQHGGTVALVPLAKGRSTTSIIEQVIEKNSLNGSQTRQVQ